VEYATGEAKEPPLRRTFDRRIKLEFHGGKLTSDGGLLAYRELDDALGLTDTAITKLLDGRRGKNTRHKLRSGLFRQAVFGRLAGYKDVNDAERLARDLACARSLAVTVRSCRRFERPDRALRDRVVGDRRQPGGADGSIRHLDRPGACTEGPKASFSTWTAPRARPWLAGGLGLERPLRLHVLSPAVLVRPVR